MYLQLTVIRHLQWQLAVHILAMQQCCSSFKNEFLHPLILPNTPQKDFLPRSRKSKLHVFPLCACLLDFCVKKKVRLLPPHVLVL